MKTKIRLRHLIPIFYACSSLIATNAAEARDWGVEKRGWNIGSGIYRYNREDSIAPILRSGVRRSEPNILGGYNYYEESGLMGHSQGNIFGGHDYFDYRR